MIKIYQSSDNMKVRLESSLSRLEYHSRNGFFVISAFKSDEDEEDNYHQHDLLMKDLRQLDLGFIELYGHWKDLEGNVLQELSLFVPYNHIFNPKEFESITLRLMSEYDQEAVLFKDPQNGKASVQCLYQGGKTEDLGQFRPHQLGDIYSQLKKGTQKSFTFEGYRVPQNFTSAMSMAKKGYLVSGHLRESKNICFWVHGYDIYELYAIKHVEFILKNLSLFDITESEIKSTYEKYNEPLYSEGKAREEIIKKVAKDGWVRVRHYVGRNDYWSIQTDRYERRKGIIKNFVNKALNKYGMVLDDEVCIVSYDTNSVLSYTSQDGGVARLLERKLNK
jgi:hypothetical protein